MPVTPAMLADLRGRLARYQLDPIGFVRDILQMEPHPGQQAWLRSAYRKDNLLVTGNRWGKSTGAAAKSIWRAVYRSGWTKAVAEAQARKSELYRVGNISITADQAAIVWLKAYGLLQDRRASWLVKDVKMTPFPRMEFVTGAVLEARSTARDGQYLHGHTWDAINWDEAALEQKFEHIRDNVVRLRVMDRRGLIDYTSTPQGRNEFGRFYLAAREGKVPNAYAQAGRSTENPNIPLDEIELTASKLSERRRRQSIEGEVVDADDGLFALEDILAAVDEALSEVAVVVQRDREEQPSWLRLKPDGEWWETRYPSHRYVHGWDLADKKDWAVGFTIDTSMEPRMPVVEFERFQKQGWKHVYARIRDRHTRFGGSGHSTTVVDSTGVGDTVVEELSDIRAEGFTFTKASKADGLANLESMLNLRELSYPFIMPLHEELTTYLEDDDDLVTDCVMALLIAALYAKRHRPHVVSWGSVKMRR